MNLQKHSRRDALKLAAMASLASTSTGLAKPTGGSRKKGLCITTKQNSWVEKLTSLEAKWFYSWGGKRHPDTPDSVEFIPMAYGYWGDKENIRKIGELASESGTKELLGFNEPDKKSQSSISVEKALDAWPVLMDTGLRLGSPACVHADTDWMKAFMAGIKKRGLRVDFVTVHSYGGSNAGQLVKQLERLRKLYGKPLWLTEFAVGDWSAKSPGGNKHKPATVLKFMQEILPPFEKMNCLERYAWFPAGQKNNALGTSALYEKSGKLTRLGEFYRDF